MASSRGTSNGPDVRDCAEALRAFEEQNRVRIVITVRPCRGQEAADFWLEGKALSEHDVSGVRTLLAFASVKCLGSRHTTMDSAVLALLYQLDFQLAEKEFASVAKTAEPPPAP